MHRLHREMLPTAAAHRRSGAGIGGVKGSQLGMLSRSESGKLSSTANLQFHAGESRFPQIAAALQPGPDHLTVSVATRIAFTFTFVCVWKSQVFVREYSCYSGLTVVAALRCNTC